MKITVTFEFDRTSRLAVARHYGEDKPANYESMRAWIENTVDGELDTVRHDYDTKHLRGELGEDVTDEL